MGGGVEGEGEEVVELVVVVDLLRIEFVFVRPARM